MDSIQRQSRESTPPPFEVLAAAAADARVVQMLHGPDVSYWHHHIHRLFSIAGISTCQIEHMKHDPKWQAWLTVDDFPLPADDGTEAKQLRKILSDGGLEVVNNQLNIVDRRGDKLRVVFNLDLG